MNIKSVLSPQQLSSVKSVEKPERTIQTDTTHDRDPSNNSGYQQNSKSSQEPLTDEEIKYYLDHLRNLPFVKEHNWIIELLDGDLGSRFVVVKDNLGQTIRRFPELDLRTLPTDLDDKKGQLFKRAA